VIAALGLISAVIYGASDFLGGLASRRMSALLASALGCAVAALGSGIAVAVERPTWSAADVVLGVIAGVLGAIGTWAFYACLAIGPMSIVSPGVAMIYAVAALLLAVPRQRDGGRMTPRAILLGTIAGLGYAGYIILMDRTSAASGLMPLFVELSTGVVLYAGVLAVHRVRRGPAELAAARGLRALGPALLAGLLLVIANTLLVIGLHLGDLAVMGVLNALYPLGTVLLALAVLRERLSRLQVGGIVLALLASAALAFG